MQREKKFVVLKLKVKVNSSGQSILLYMYRHEIERCGIHLYDSQTFLSTQ